MSTKNWKCYACVHVGPKKGFAGCRCGKCGSEDVFPHRIFRCKKCGKTMPQADFFHPDLGLDEDPSKTAVGRDREAHWVGRLGRNLCGSTDWEQVG